MSTVSLSLFGAASRTINDKHPFNNSSANFREDHLQSDHTSASKPDSASQDNSTELSSETSSASFPHPDLLLPSISFFLGGVTISTSSSSSPVKSMSFTLPPSVDADVVVVFLRFTVLGEADGEVV
jgi:hypothetical protein